MESVEARRTTTELDPELWLDEHGEMLYSFALFRVRNPVVAEDLVQDTLLSALTARKRFLGNSSERTWLIGILKHKILDYVRQSAKLSLISTQEGDGEAEFEDNFSLEELIVAAGELAGDTKLTDDEFRERVNNEPTKKVSKVLELYYLETYHEGFSKPMLGQSLKELAIKRIKNDEPRGRLGTRYEFEDAIEKVGALLSVAI